MAAFKLPNFMSLFALAAALLAAVMVYS
eukprot:COSAG05_NODE_19772_length_288_cov_0.544974_1_plen_27_part_01